MTQRVKTFVVATALMLAPALAVAGQGAVIEQVLVKVNGEIFTKSDLEERQAGALRSMGQLDANSKPTDVQLQQMLNELTPQLVVSVIDEILLVQRGKELNYSLSDEQFKSIVENIKKENKIETDEAFQAALKEENVTMADLRRNLERQMMVSNVTRNEVQGKITVTNDESRRYYDEHIKDFTTSPSVTLREVLIAAPAGDGTTAREVSAREKLQAIRARAVAGEDFSKLASEASESASRANGGLIGPLSLDDLSMQVRQLIEPLQPGDVTEVLRTAAGYQILRLDTTTPRQTKSFDEVKDQVSEKVYDEKSRTESTKHIEKLRQQAVIEWKNRELQKAYENGLTQTKNTPPPQ